MPAPLVAALVPLLPGLVSAVIAIVETLSNDPDTPEDLKIRLAALSEALTQATEKVQAVQLPD